ncbi:MAG: TonB-dependent receptor [Oceanicaulis sp.]|jgi:outer membrane receptor protein involved in Fe transport|uniref:TonB-dependent receptor n=1 Tax=unclassified Oceanicaulis TaxID=2632123 RepID=UPI000066D501|nr:MULTISPECIES: TonB-dependent receptor [unclassified Oceanicaulis]EAP91638.1 TonB-dependent receptor [Oceanicaulis sp. HTCC2633]MAB69910.1 TonB-dependent receptor [Oceanicaulis sp.]MBC38074.1 TonB-dependent receptor [Oceanicaulis sp.]MBG34974.1 TonB-dependent receptor [Oceanicaulis sp.]HCR95473.1 TonB-dependent receptor [Oceanicaulis sp.]|tara:strand:- start:738 stop:3077 length:2340 start_codon:yes stop_codon:yes gene_type:complete
MTNHLRIALLASVAFAAPVAAQETSPDADVRSVTDDVITVTARFREETVQDIGASVAGISGAEIRERGIQDIEDLARSIAGMANVKTRQNSNDIAIRGVRSAGSGYETSTVFSVFVDDVSVTGAGNLRDFSSVDLNRIEVIRGPQPTLFGEGAVGGVIRYFTNDPDLDGPRITGEAAGRYETITDGGTAYTVQNATSLVLVPGKVGLRLSGFHRNDDGFIDNPSEGEDVNDFETSGGRAVLLAQLSPRLEVRLSAFLSRDELGESTQIDPGSDPEDLTFSASPRSGSYTDDFDLYAGRVTYSFDAIDVTSITGYYERSTASALFSAGNSFGLAPFFPTIDTTAFNTSSSEFEQFSQEFRFVSDFSGPLNFTAGVYYRDREDVSGQFLTGDGFVTVTNPSSSNLATRLSSTQSEQYSAFAEFTFELTERLRLIGGVRYVNDTVTAILQQDDVVNLVPQFDGQGNLIPWTESNPIGFVSTLDLLTGAGFGTEFEFELEKFLPRAGVEFELSEDMLLYANIAQGARNGGIGNAIAALGASGGSQDVFFQNLTFDDDQVLSVDAGVKASWFDGDLITNLGVFHTTYEDTQIQVNTPANNTVNGPEQTILGLELETRLQVNDSLSTFLNLSVIDAEFDQGKLITSAPGGTYGQFDLRKGNAPANIPEYTLAAGYSFERPIGASGWSLNSNGSFQYVGQRFSNVQNFESAELDSLELLNLRIGVSNDRWGLHLYGTNLLNDVEAVSIGSNPLQQFVTADGALDAPIIAASVNRPRAVGLSLSLRY